MTSNQLRNPEDPQKGPFFPPGFGLGVRVRLDNAADYPTLGSAGEYGWEGIMTTYVSIDPAEHMVALVLAQPMFDDDGPVKCRAVEERRGGIVRFRPVPAPH